jgi:endonuclease YncB( thermonuclease family)
MPIASRTLFAPFLLFLLAPAARAEVGKVVAVADGDTLTILTAEKEQVKVRLHGIDAPERKQAFGTKARERLAELAMGKTATASGSKRDKYGRTVASLSVDGRDIGEQLVAEGLAWHYVRYSDDRRLAEAERKARAARLGLWRDADPVPPWEWRATAKERRRDEALSR